MTNLLPLAFLRKSKIFFEKPICFLSKTQICNGWRNLTIPVAFCDKFANFGVFKKYLKDNFFEKNQSSIFQKEATFEPLRNLTTSVAIYGKFGTFSSF